MASNFKFFYLFSNSNCAKNKNTYKVSRISKRSYKNVQLHLNFKRKMLPFEIPNNSSVTVQVVLEKVL